MPPIGGHISGTGGRVEGQTCREEVRVTRDDLTAAAEALDVEVSAPQREQQGTAWTQLSIRGRNRGMSVTMYATSRRAAE